MNELFRIDNTEGYSDKKRRLLNAEWQLLVDRYSFEYGTDDYNDSAKLFCDNVSKRYADEG